tara:strand:- start:420 stop:632 length:213 start_codon:yes stop_codon:yes gene_type:complete
MIDQLTEVYNKWCEDNNLPRVSADEQDKDQLTHEQKLWLDDFIEQWDNQNNIDYFIYKNMKKTRGNNEKI